MRLGLLRPPVLFQDDRQVEVRVRRAGVHGQRTQVGRRRRPVLPEVVLHVAQIEAALVGVRFETDRPLVERHGLDQMAAPVVEVGQIDERRHE